MKRLVGAGSDQLRSPEYCITTSLCSASTLDDEDGGDEDIEYVDIEYDDIDYEENEHKDIEYEDIMYDDIGSNTKLRH